MNSLIMPKFLTPNRKDDSINNQTLSVLNKDDNQEQEDSQVGCAGAAFSACESAGRAQASGPPPVEPPNGTGTRLAGGGPELLAGPVLHKPKMQRDSFLVFKPCY